MRDARSSRGRSRPMVVGAGVLALCLVSSSAGAAVSSGDDAAALASAITSPGAFSAASLQVDYDCVGDDAGTPEDEAECPTGVGSSPMAGFPTSGATFTIMTSGNAALADDPNDGDSSGLDWYEPSPAIGPEVYDHQVLRIDLGPATGNCLAFDFAFLSEEYPEFIASGYNDAFIAQLNTWAVTADPSTQTLTAPGNFAAGAGDSISVDGAGPSAMAVSQATGTTYDAATLPLIARTQVAPGTTNSLYLTIFDQGDGIYDSAVFLDHLRFETQPTGRCKSLALDPFEGTTGVVVQPGTTGTFSSDLATFTVPLVSNLPTGPIAATVSGVASFLEWDDVASRTSPRAANKTTTALGSGTAIIPGGGVGNLMINNSPAGVAAIEAAKAEPAALLAQGKKAKKKSKKMAKKAKKLKKRAKAASGNKARKLTKKAKKLTKRSKALKKHGARLTRRSRALANSPLGTVVVTLTNSANATSEQLRLQVPR